MDGLSVCCAPFGVTPRLTLKCRSDKSTKWFQLGKYDELNVMLLAECAKAASLRVVWYECHPDFFNVVGAPDCGQILLAAKNSHPMHALSNLLPIIGQEAEQTDFG